MASVTSSPVLSAEASRAFSRLAADLARVFGPRFIALVAYGPATSMGFVESITADDLDACGVLVEAWHRDKLATPLLITEDEFRRSLDTFPLEYQAILDRHVLVAGRSPFDGCRIDPDDLRHACEVQARSHLIHLREGWMQAGAHDGELSALVARSAAPLRALLMNVARLHGTQAATAEELAAFAERDVGMSGDLVRNVLALEGVVEPTRERRTFCRSISRRPAACGRSSTRGSRSIDERRPHDWPPAPVHLHRDRFTRTRPIAAGAHRARQRLRERH